MDGNGQSKGAPSGRERARAAEATLDGLRVSVDILGRVAINTDAGQALDKRVGACMRELLTLPLPQQPGFEQAIAAFEDSVADTASAVLDADLEVPLGTFRRKLNPGTLTPKNLAAYARGVAARPFEGGPRQARFVLAATHALCSMTPGHGLEARPDDEAESILEFLLEGLPADSSRRDEITELLDAARERLSTFQNTEQMFAADFDREINALKGGLGAALLDRDVLQALVRFEIAYLSRQLAIPASAHPMSLPPGARKPPPLPPPRPSLRAAVAASLRPPPPASLASIGGGSLGLDELLSEAAARATLEDGSAPLDAATIVESGDQAGAAPLSELAGHLEPDGAADEQWAEGDELAGRVAAIADVLAILKELGVEAGHVELVEQTLAVCTDSLERLGDPDSKGYAERRETYEESLAVGEATTQDVDATISMESFRSWYDRSPRPRDQLVRYASLLGASRRLGDVQRDRLEFVATRLLSHEVDGGRLAISSRTEAAPVLEYIIRTRPMIADHERSGAVMFFRDATLQLSTLHTLDDVFSGGFYLDVRGYKVALRQQLMDPDVLYAAIALNTAIHNRIEEMRELEARSKNSLHDMLGEEELEVAKAFKRASLRADARFEETRRYLEKYRHNVKKGVLRKTTDRRTVVRVLLGAAIAGVGLFAFKLISREVNSIDAMTDDALGRLSPVLESGGFSRGESQRTFIGRVASARWMLLTPEEREEAADVLCTRLGRQRIRAAWVTREGHQAIHIAGGEVVSVE